MKKLFIAAVAVLAFSLANAQEGGFKGGIHLGIPLGDIKDFYSFNGGLDLAYMWPVSDEFKVGVATGYDYYAGKTVNTGFGDVKYDAASFIPVAGTAQYSFTESIYGGLDLGYAIGVAPSGIDSGVLYQPKVGYQTAKYEIYLGYKGISVSGGAFSSVGLGFNYKF